VTHRARAVEAVADWARCVDPPRLRLWVTSTDAVALALYARSGFAPTGRTKPLDHTPL
jgi:hypothetical protein